MKVLFRYVMILLLFCPLLSFGQDSLNVSLLSQVHHNWSFAFGLDVQDDIACVATYWTGLRVLDVSDPTNPTELDSFICDATCKDVVVRDSLAYAVFANDDMATVPGLYIFNVSNPSDIALIGHILFNGNLDRIILQDSLLFMQSDRETVIVDIVDPANPTQIGYYLGPFCATVSCIDVLGDYLFVTAEDSGCKVVDVSDPSVPHAVSTIALEDVREIAIKDSVAWLTCWMGDSTIVKSYDIRNPLNPVELAEYCLNYIAWQIDIYDTLAFIGLSEDIYGHSKGMLALDISDPTMPDSLFTMNPVFYRASQLSVEDDIAYISDDRRGVRCFDITDPNLVHEIGYFAAPYAIYDLAILDTILYAVDATKDLWILDVSDPAAPEVVNYLHIEDLMTVSIPQIYSGFLYLTHPLLIFDVSDPVHPQLLSAPEEPIGSNGFIQGIGDYIYVTTGINQLAIMDVSDPSNPECLTIMDQPQAVHAILDSTAYCANDSGIAVYDISNPVLPVFTEQIPIEGLFSNIDTSNGFIYCVHYPYDNPYIKISRINSNDGEYITEEACIDSILVIHDMIMYENKMYMAGVSANIRDYYTIYILEFDDSMHYNKLGYYLPDYPMGAAGIYCSNNIIYNSSFTDGIAIYYTYDLDNIDNELSFNVPATFALTDIYPNPFNSTVTIVFSLPESGFVTMNLYNILGEQVYSTGEYYLSGENRWTFNTDSEAPNLASGTYFLQIDYRKQTFTRKIILLK